MAGSIAASPGVAITPSSVKATLPTNYITNFNFLSQYLPDTYEQEFERYGNRSIASFLRMVGAELPSNSDMIKWAEQGRLHTKYTGVSVTGAVATGLQTFDIGTGTHVFRLGQTVILSSASNNKLEKGIITATNGTDQFTVAQEATNHKTCTLTISQLSLKISMKFLVLIWHKLDGLR